tara:strand:- start:2656 stop:2919 length:264 start_codon:yes stop_codon:yes gene_type:complete
MQGNQVIERILELHRALNEQETSKGRLLEIEKEMISLSRAIVHATCEKKGDISLEEFPNLATDHALFGSIKTLESKLKKYRTEGVET